MWQNKYDLSGTKKIKTNMSEDSIETRKLLDTERRREEDDNESKSDYEEAISATGYSKFHLALILICGWINASDAVEVLSVAFLLPSAECDLFLTSTDKGLLSSIIFVGMMVGGYLWGSLGDVFGRKTILMWSLTVNGLFGFLSSLSQPFWLMLTARFFSGVGVGGSIPVVWSYCSEFQPKDKRGAALSVLATFWPIGNLITAGLAWAIIPQKNLGYFSSTFTMDSWRIFVALCTIPSLSAAMLLFLFPESPKFLMEQGKEEAALVVFRGIYRWNNPRASEEYKITGLRMPNKIYTKMLGTRDLVLINSSVRRKCSWFLNKTVDTVFQLFRRTSDLFQRSLRRSTLILLVIHFSLAFGYYGLWMWFPELLKRLEQSSQNGQISICNNLSPNGSFTINCTQPTDNKMFIDEFIMSASNFPGAVISILFIDRLGRKILLVSSMIASGLTVFFIWFVSSHLDSLILSSVFGMLTNITWNTLDVLVTEIFPTDLRATSLGFCLLLARIAAILANLIFGFFVDLHCSLPILLIAVLFALGGLSSIFLPNTTRISLQ